MTKTLDKRLQAVLAMVESVLAEVAAPRTCDTWRTALYMLKREFWHLVDPHCATFSRRDAQQAQQRAQDMAAVGVHEGRCVLPPFPLPSALQPALRVLSSPVLVRVLNTLLSSCVRAPLACVRSRLTCIVYMHCVSDFGLRV